MRLPLRAVVLDNDETTGSYGIVFALVNYLRTERQPSLSTVATILDKLAIWMLGQDVFRPGLEILLDTLVNLRKNGSINAIIMYTNQTELPIPTTYPGLDTYPPFLWSIPYCIAYMMNSLVKTNIFTYILARPTSLRHQKGIVPKTFSRVLGYFPDYPADLHHITFVDDCATSEFLLDTDIPEEGRCKKARYPVNHYVRYLQPEEVYSCLLFCFEDVYLLNEMYPKVYSEYLKYVKNHKKDMRGDMEFSILSQILLQKYFIV
jgi:hypothetical protein